eukprot:gene17029-20419_t
MLNLSIILTESAKRYGKQSALTHLNEVFSYEEFDKFSNQIAHGLIQKGLRPGDKIALSCPNNPYFPILYFGILKMGAIVVPLNIFLKQQEIEYHLQDSEAKAYFCYEGTPELPTGQFGRAAYNSISTCFWYFEISSSVSISKIAQHTRSKQNIGSLIAGQDENFDCFPSSAEDTAVIIYTSGTTGIPKGACLSHLNLFMNAMVASNLFQTTAGQSVLTVLPLFHIFGMTTMMNASIYTGLNSVLLSRFDARECFELIDRHNISVFAGVPTMYWSLLNTVHETLSEKVISEKLKLCVSGGAPLPFKIIQDFEERFKVPIIEGYGMSEGSPIVTFNQLQTGRKAGSIGTHVWGIDVKIVDEKGVEQATGVKGELIYKGHNVMKGYHNKPSETSEVLKNGWMYSGDIAYKDKDGFYFIVDRSKDVIIRGGMNVYPREIEEVLIKHEAISMTAVIGLADPKLGEEIAACIVLKAGSKATAPELIDWIKTRVASYKYPRHICFLESLPVNGAGKILKRVLREQFPLSRGPLWCTLTFLFFSPLIYAQQKILTGKVKDTSGNPIPGAVVRILGTNIATSTDQNGAFRISNSSSKELNLRITYVGYTEKIIVVPSGQRDKPLEIVLQQQATEMDAVVVTGVFDKRKRMDASVAITSLSPVQIERTVPASAADLLKNVPGVFVNSSLGEIRNSVASRGITIGTQDGSFGYEYVSMQEDGLPVTN